MKKDWSDEDGEFTSGAFKNVCGRNRIKWRLTMADSLHFYGVSERTIGIIELIAEAAHIEAPVLFPRETVPNVAETTLLWAEAMLWECDSLNCTATTANRLRTPPHETWYRILSRVKSRLSSSPASTSREVKKDKPRAVTCFYMGPSLDRMHDAVCILDSGGNVVTTRHLTW